LAEPQGHCEECQTGLAAWPASVVGQSEWGSPALAQSLPADQTSSDPEASVRSLFMKLVRSFFMNNTQLLPLRHQAAMASMTASALVVSMTALLQMLHEIMQTIGHSADTICNEHNE